MSDEIDPPAPGAEDGTGGRHQQARTLAEQAMRAQADGDDDRADELFAEASKIDPDAVANALADASANPDDTATGTDAAPQDDEQIAAMSRTVQPGSDAPSRSGIGGRGSGADTEGH